MIMTTIIITIMILMIIIIIPVKLQFCKLRDAVGRRANPLTSQMRNVLSIKIMVIIQT